MSDLALRSKAHWGYSAEFLEACRQELTLTEGYISRQLVFVGERGDRVVGFYAIEAAPRHGELAYLYVEPETIGQRVGAELIAHAVRTAAAHGLESLLVQADPFAEPFYRRLGAERVGESESGSVPGRMLPLLRIG